MELKQCNVFWTFPEVVNICDQHHFRAIISSEIDYPEIKTKSNM